TPPAQLVVGVAEGKAGARLLARQFDARLAGHAQRDKLTVLGEDGGEIGAAGTGVHDFEGGRLGLGRGLFLPGRRLRSGRRPRNDQLKQRQHKQGASSHGAATVSESGILPSADSSTASGRVVSNCARTIKLTTVMGTHRNMPTTPQIVPHTTSETITTSGDRF